MCIHLWVCVHECLFWMQLAGSEGRREGRGGEGMNNKTQWKEGDVLNLIASGQFSRLRYDAFVVHCGFLILNSDWRGSRDQLLPHLHWQELDTTGIQEWGRERERRRERVEVREMPVIKPSPDSLGRLGELRDWALGQKQVASEPVPLVSTILLSGPSVSWDARRWSYSPRRITVAAVSCEHVCDSNADMWTKGWGCPLPAPLCTRQLNYRPSWKGKQMTLPFVLTWVMMSQVFCQLISRCFHR